MTLAGASVFFFKVWETRLKSHFITALCQRHHKDTWAVASLDMFYVSGGSGSLETAGERTLCKRFSDTSDLKRNWMMAAPPSLVVMSWGIGSLLLFVKSGGWKVA